jgi:hypothetical protein
MVAPAEHGVTLVDGDGEPLPAEEHVDLLYLDPSIGEVKYAGNDGYVRRAFGVRAATLTVLYAATQQDAVLYAATQQDAQDQAAKQAAATQQDAQDQAAKQAAATQQDAPQSTEQ